MSFKNIKKFLNKGNKRQIMKKTEKNIIYNAIYQLLLICLPLVTSPYLSRILGVKGIGMYSYYYSYAYYFVIAIMLGLNNYGNRSIAICRDHKKELDKTFSEIYSMQLIIGIIVLIFYIIFCISTKNIITFLFIPYIVSAIIDLNWFFFGLEKFKLTITRNIFIKLLSVALIFIFVRKADDIYNYVIIMSFGFLLNQICILPFVRGNVNFNYQSIKKFKHHIKPNLVLFIPVIAVSLYKVMDKIMLG